MQGKAAQITLFQKTYVLFFANIARGTPTACLWRWLSIRGIRFLRHTPLFSRQISTTARGCL